MIFKFFNLDHYFYLQSLNIRGTNFYLLLRSNRNFSYRIDCKILSFIKNLKQYRIYQNLIICLNLSICGSQFTFSPRMQAKNQSTSQNELLSTLQLAHYNLQLTMALRRNYLDNITEPLNGKPAIDPPLQQYNLLLEFDLKREKEKNAILQQRLKNKQIFIQQMKHFQEELTLAYQQCKNQLILAQQKIQYLQNVEYREYVQQISDLKHMLLARKEESKRNSLGKEDKLPLAAVANKVHQNKSEKRLASNIGDRRDSKANSQFATQRSRTLEQKLQQEVGKQFKKSVNFIFHFLQMAECYIVQLKGESNLTKRLKRSWKWIKDVVKQWDFLLKRQQQFKWFREQLGGLFGVQKEVQLNFLLELIKSKSSVAT